MIGGLAGIFGDRRGHRWLLMVALCLHAGSLALALAAPTPAVLIVSIGLAGAAFAAGNVAGFNLAMDFAPAERKGSYSGAFWFVTAGFTALGAPAAGLLVDALSYGPFFLITLAAPLGGLLLLRRFADPRLARN